MGRPDQAINKYQDRIAGVEFPVVVAVGAADVDRHIFTARKACTVKAIQYLPTVIGSDGSAVTATVRRQQGTEGPTAGDDLLGSTKLDLKGTANTLQAPDLTGTTANLSLAAGNGLSLDVTGDLTAVVGVLTVWLAYD